MKSTSRYIAPALILSLLAGCVSSDNNADYETQLGTREQKNILAKAQPLEDFGFTPMYPFGNQMLYFGAAMLQPNLTASKTFKLSGMPVIQIRGHSALQKMSVLLDTAANASWMQYSSAKKNEVTFLTMNDRPIPYLGSDSTGGVNTFAGVIPHLQIDQIILQNTPFYVRMVKGPMKPVVYSTMVPHVDAVLGYDNLRQFEYIRFDLHENTVEFSTTKPYVPNEERLVGKVGLSTVCYDRLAVNGSIYGQAVPVVLDFCGDYAFARNDTREAVTKQVEMGDVVWRNLKTEVLTMQHRYPRAGRRMLEKYMITVCPRTGVVYFERPTE